MVSADVGFGCRHVLHGNTEEEVLDALMRHIDMERDSDWFEHEVVYALCGFQPPLHPHEIIPGPGGAARLHPESRRVLSRPLWNACS